jgi:hypothetical protein
VTFLADGVEIAADPDSPYQTVYTVPASHIVGTQIRFTARAADFAGNTAGSDPFLVRVVAPGAGEISGRVYDDTRGLPVENAAVALVSVHGEAPVDILEVYTDAQGVYRIPAPEGTVVLRIDAPNTTAAWRTVSVKPDRVTPAYDARLTPLAEGVPVDHLVGADFQYDALGADLEAPAGAFGEDVALTLTRPSEQGLPGPLPTGWRPVSALHFGPDAHPLNTSLTLRLWGPDHLDDPDTAPVPVLWDPDETVWRRIPSDFTGTEVILYPARTGALAWCGPTPNRTPRTADVNGADILQGAAFTPDVRLKYGAEYRLTVRGLVDYSGQKMSSAAVRAFRTFRPRAIGSADVAYPSGVSVLGADPERPRLAVANGALHDPDPNSRGLVLLDVTDPSEPLFLREEPILGDTFGVLAVDDAAAADGPAVLGVGGGTGDFGTLRIYRVGGENLDEFEPAGFKFLSIPAGYAEEGYVKEGVPRHSGIPQSISMLGNDDVYISMIGIGVLGVRLSEAVSQHKGDSANELPGKFVLDAPVAAVPANGALLVADMRRLAAISPELNRELKTFEDIPARAAAAGDGFPVGFDDAGTAVLKNLAFVGGTDGVLTVLDMEFPDNPTILSQIQIGGSIRAIRPDPQNRLVYASNGQTVVVVDAHGVDDIDDDRDRVLGTVEGLDGAGALDIRDGFGYVADPGRGKVHSVLLRPTDQYHMELYTRSGAKVGKSGVKRSNPKPRVILTSPAEGEVGESITVTGHVLDPMMDLADNLTAEMLTLSINDEEVAVTFHRAGEVGGRESARAEFSKEIFLDERTETINVKVVNLLGNAAAAGFSVITTPPDYEPPDIIDVFEVNFGARGTGQTCTHSGPNCGLIWGTAGNASGEFATPTDLDFDDQDNVYIVDHSNNRIQKFDSTGTFILEWGGKGDGNGQFLNPTGIHVDEDGHVYIADTLNHRIQKFGPDGDFLLKIGEYGVGNGQFETPVDVAVDTFGNIFVVDRNNHRIQKFDSSGQFLLQWGGDGSADGRFHFPSGILVSGVGEIWVADTGNHRLQKFNLNGNYLSKWGDFGFGPGELAAPTGLTENPQGDIFVCDTGNNRILRFNEIDPSPFIIGGFESPCDIAFSEAGAGVAVGASGDIFVTDGRNNRILMFY